MTVRELMHVLAALDLWCDSDQDQAFATYREHFSDVDKLDRDALGGLHDRLANVLTCSERLFRAN
jgi:hypothetical protein